MHTRTTSLLFWMHTRKVVKPAIKTYRKYWSLCLDHRDAHFDRLWCEHQTAPEAFLQFRHLSLSKSAIIAACRAVYLYTFANDKTDDRFWHNNRFAFFPRTATITTTTTLGSIRSIGIMSFTAAISSSMVISPVLLLAVVATRTLWSSG